MAEKKKGNKAEAMSGLEENLRMLAGDEQIEFAFEILRRHGLGGRHLYVPKAAAVKGTKEQVVEMIEANKPVSEIVSSTGFTSSYIYYLRKELEAKKAELSNRAGNEK
ncbi:hypothetical protein [Geotalea sp. SG265]|uniref:hypothetical protein n=1 Tax=Geotalea sp. SG265 TaxID=2922867 RepID=UPI001FAF2A20|nr:hypothetical protein [Geotalea sp. SG265]